MNRRTLLTKIRLLKVLERDKADIEEKINQLKQDIKDEMELSNTYSYKGRDYKVSWDLVESKRFDQSSFQEDHPKLYKEYLKPVSYRRFLIS